MPSTCLLPECEHRTFAIKDVRSIYFVREFSDDFEPERKAFLSGQSWRASGCVLKFRDN